MTLLFNLSPIFKERLTESIVVNRIWNRETSPKVSLPSLIVIDALRGSLKISTSIRIEFEFRRTIRWIRKYAPEFLCIKNRREDLWKVPLAENLL